MLILVKFKYVFNYLFIVELDILLWGLMYDINNLEDFCNDCVILI